MGGVFVSEGMHLRIPAGGLTVTVNDRGELDTSLTFEVSLEVWPVWLDVGIDHAIEALGSRRTLAAAITESGNGGLDGETQSELILSECKSAMVSIAAAAFALDNFYSVIREFAPGISELERQWAAARTARHRRVSEAIRRTFRVNNASARNLNRSVREIFQFRDWAVHPAVEFREPRLHPLLGSAVEWRFIAFSANNAGNAVGNAASIISQCVRAPREANPPLAKWCEGQLERTKLRQDRVQQSLLV